MTAIVRASKFRRSPLPQGGLEIPITLMVSQGDTTSQIFSKMKGLVAEYYMEPENIPAEITVEDDEEDSFLI